MGNNPSGRALALTLAWYAPYDRAPRFILQWRHYERGSFTYHQRLHSLLNCSFRRRSKKTSDFSVTGLCAGNSPVTSEFPEQKASNAGNVSIWWHHYDSVPWGWLIRCPTWPTKFWPFCPIPFFSLPGFPVPQRGLLNKGIPSTADVGPCLPRIYHTFEQLESYGEKVRYRTKVKKITFVLGVYKSAHYFSANRAARPIFNTKNYGETILTFKQP